MKSILSNLSRLFQRKRRRAPLELHRLPWHPLFYVAVKMHMENTTPHRRFQ